MLMTDDATEDKFETGSFMMQKTGLVDYKLNDKEVRFTDVAVMPEKRGKAATPTTVQREHVHKSIAGQEDAGQEGYDDHVAKANPDKGDEATQIPDMEILTKPRKPPDAGCTEPMMIGPGLLQTSLMVMLLTLIMALQCPTGGPDDILRFNKSVVGSGGDICVEVQVDDQGDDHVRAPFDEGGSMTRAVHDDVPVGGNIHVQAPVDEGGGAVLVLIDVSAVLTMNGADKVLVPVVDNGGAAQVLVAEGGGAVPVPVDDKGGAVHDRVPVEDSGGDVPIHTDGGGHVCVKAHIDEGGVLLKSLREEP